jgi:hypothetical protein
MHSQYHGTMSDAVFQTVLDRLASLTLDTVYPCLENEPFADPAIFERADALFNTCNALWLKFTTNALLLDAKKRKQLALLLEGKNHEIQIIFHGTQKEHYTRVMGIPFSESLENVLGLLLLAQDAELHVTVCCAGQGPAGSLFQNYSCSKEAFFLFWESLFRKHNIRKRPRMRYRPYLDRTGSSLHRSGIHMLPPIREDLKTLHCLRVPEHLHVLHTGELVLCSMDYERGTLFGNLMQNDLAGIFSSEAWNLLSDSARGLRATPYDFLCKRCLYPERAM